MATNETLHRIASGFEELSTNPDGMARQAIIGDLAQAFRQLQFEGAGGTRKSINFATAETVVGGEAVGIINIAKSFIINKVTSDTPCRIRLYPSLAFRVADGPRPIGVDPIGEFGLLLELVLTTSFLEFSLSPPAVGYNDDDPTSTAIYYAIENHGAFPKEVTITIDYTELVP